MNKGILLVGIAVLILIGAFWGNSLLQPKNIPAVPQTAFKKASQSVPTTAAVPTMTSKSDTSDPALDKDFQAVQGNLNKLDQNQSVSNQDATSQDTPQAQ